MKIHHIGMVVNNIVLHYETYYKNVLGYNDLSEIYIDDKIGVSVAFLNLNDKIYLEFVQPLNEYSPVSNFLKKRGQTLHHLCFEVDDIDAECERFRNNNYMVTMKPVEAVAFKGKRVAFLMCKDENHLIELLER